MARKGHTNNPNGRPVGTPNRSTSDARAAIAMLVEGNVDRLNGWLDQIAKGIPSPDGEGKWIRQPDPQGAFKCLMDVCEYHIPRLARTEHVGDKGAPIEHRVLHEVDKSVIDRYTRQITEGKK